MRLRLDRPRVFCVGWHKTGTTTIGLALIKLGYSVIGCRLDMVHPLRRGEIEQVIELAGRFDAVQDVPWAALFKKLDVQYPGSKFILTERRPESWIASASRHFASTPIPLHEWLYGQGILRGNEDLYLARYQQHNADVKAYFANRPGDLLILDFERGHGWDRLCSFLQVPVPAARFPHENKAAVKRNFGEQIYHGLRSAVPARARQAFFDFRMKIRAARGLPDPRNRFNNFRENRAERTAWVKGGRSQ